MRRQHRAGRAGAPRMRAWLLVALLGLSACASTEFRALDDGRVIRGNGGTPVEVDGMEVWMGSAPTRPHRIIGYIEDDRAAILWPMARRLPDIVRLARRAGGQAVVIDGAGSERVSPGTRYGQASVFDSGYAEAGSIGSTSAGQTYQASAAIRSETRAAVIRFDP